METQTVEDERQEALLALAGAKAHLETVAKIDPEGRIGIEAEVIVRQIELLAEDIETADYE